MSNSSQELPRHIGLILDGNRRWAKKHGKRTLEGHQAGSDVFRNISLYLFEKKIPYVSAFIFSTENWKRTKEEVSYLMNLAVKAVENHLKEFHAHDIKISFIGERTGIPKKVLKALDSSAEETKNNTSGELVLCFNYGGKQEIVQAAQKAAQSGEDVTEDLLDSCMYAPHIPEIDLIVRTSGEERLSGFMLWRSTYAEMYFTDTLWPDMTKKDIDTALEDYSCRVCRFGS